LKITGKKFKVLFYNKSRNLGQSPTWGHPVP